MKKMKSKGKLADKPADADISFEELPGRGALFAQKAIEAFAAELPETMTPRYMAVQYLAIIFGAEILSAFGEKMLIEEGYSEEKVRALRTAARSTIASTGADSTTVLADIKKLMN